MTPAPVTIELARLGRRSVALRAAAAFGELPEPTPRSLPLRLHQPPNLGLSNTCQDGIHHLCPRWSKAGADLLTWWCRCLCHQALVGDYQDYLAVERGQQP